MPSKNPGPSFNDPHPSFWDSDALPTMDTAPEFLKQGLDMSKVQQTVTTPKTEEEQNDIAEVSSDKPYNIKVVAPDLYGPPIRDHELTHTFQFTRNPDISPTYQQVASSDKYPYEYGGLKGLQDARAKNKTISDFNYEQQAEMVKDYKVFHDQYLDKATKGKITPKDEKAMYDLQQAYHPFVQQLANIPGTKENLKRYPLLELLGIQRPVPITSDKSNPPGLPSYDTPGLGILPVDPLLGGKSQATDKSNQILNQVTQNVSTRFPKYAKYLSSVVISPSKNSKNDDRQVETYAPWESENPHPGKITIQPFKKELLTTEGLSNTVASELLHHIGGVNPNTGKPVDPEYYSLKQQVGLARSPKQKEIDEKEYQQAQKQGDKRSFNDWFNNSRLDEYIMGYVTPDKTDEWRKNGWYNAPVMKQAVQNVQKYLTNDDIRKTR